MGAVSVVCASGVWSECSVDGESVVRGVCVVCVERAQSVYCMCPVWSVRSAYRVCSV